MAEKSILFSTEMVKAILAGKKSVTRRVIKPQPAMRLEPSELPQYPDEWFDENGYYWRCPYPPGTVLWVKETWYDRRDRTPETQDLNAVHYAADWQPTDEIAYLHYKRPSIHMPRAAARLFLRVKSVRVERVQEISERDADAEIFGGDFAHHPSVCYKFSPVYNSDGACIEPGGCYCAGYSLVELFSMYWNDINKKRGYGWDVNPWVWVIEFEVIKDATD